MTIHRLLSVAPLAAMAMASVVHAQAVQPGDLRASPERLVQAAVEGVIGTIQSQPETRAGDLGQITAVVQKQFLPYTDFQRTTRLALGGAWRTATPEQQQQLYEQFQTLLVRSYAVSLAQLREQNVRFRYQPARAASGAADVVVQTRVITNADEMQIDYRLQRTATGWKIYDINMMGAWLIEVYRKQFADIVARNGVDGLLKYLTTHNARQASEI
ncbi:MlaC/ttg2D family ABC transporter substrate-binding protein [Cupriavidus taiwanensis]|uniref:Putative ABC-type transport system involved in resistance to organic solvents, auxiliary component n=1 Tax=Cupriavidus taiwanensis TaxID=164546 RepID=A0A375J836_9BURK|nr:ABC transporter substrate-binding protein [Cupriavidus taiwanensis]SPS00892.1 putative ABC-type transport system involved in resistance to organic solvents, auxiliary component [Cupriavidus taiwanensis]